MLHQIPLPLLSLLLISTPILPTTVAQSSTSTTTPSPSSTAPALQIVNGSESAYSYAGCWNETSGLAGTTGLRALDGPSEVLPGEMTVQKCLDFCAHGNSSTGAAHAYRLAGLEYSRECWCGDALNSLSVQLPDSACNTACDGANSTACGGALRLTVYNSTAGAEKEGSGVGKVRAEEIWRGAVLGMVLLFVLA
ncbi:WSC domain-containing protein [Xylaria arbuscula]|nr:WSC domain-containing protein [Xylaria arbuscula]